MISPIQPIVDLLISNGVKHTLINEQLVGFTVQMPTEHPLYLAVRQEEPNVPDELEAVFCRYADAWDAPGLLILDCLAPVEYFPESELSMTRFVNLLNERLVWPYLIVRSEEQLISCRLSSYVVDADDLKRVMNEMTSSLTGAILLLVSSVRFVTEDPASVDEAIERLHALTARINSDENGNQA